VTTTPGNSIGKATAARGQGARAALLVSLIFVCFALVERALGGGLGFGTAIRFAFLAASTLAVLRLAGSRERALARTDHKTGIANERHFFEAAATEVKRARRYNRSLTVALVDVDNFKEVNDRHGHREGDRLLRAVAETLRAGVRSFDLVARVGGDEFALLLPETGCEQARGALRNLTERLRERAGREGWPVSFSIGVITCDGNCCELDGLMGEADRLMYAVKRSGKDGVEFGHVGLTVLAA
jgi:diguanylate cyclase (GGDEF)-like protein